MQLTKKIRALAAHGFVPRTAPLFLFFLVSEHKLIRIDSFSWKEDFFWSFWCEFRWLAIGTSGGAGSPRIYIIYSAFCLIYISIIYFSIGLRRNRHEIRSPSFVWRKSTSQCGFCHSVKRIFDFVWRLLKIDVFAVIIGMRPLFRIAWRSVEVKSIAVPPDNITLFF